MILFAAALIATFVGYSICRLQFLFWNWEFYQKQPASDLLFAFVNAWRFDLSAIAILSLVPFFVFLAVAVFHRQSLSLRAKRILLGLFLLFQIPTMIVNLGDAEFIHFLGRRYTFDALFFFREIPGKFWSLFFTYWKLNAIDILILAALIWWVMAWLPRKLKDRDLPLKKQVLAAFGIFAAMAIAARGGLQSKPINFAHAQIFTQPMMNSLVLNSSFTLIQTVKRESLPRDHFFSNEEMLQHLRAGLAEKSLLEGHRLKTKPNIVLIIVESLGREYIGSLNGDAGFTPFLDELSVKSLVFKDAYANARRSIEGIGAIMAGIPSLMNEPFLSSQYLTNYYAGLGTVLQGQGYHTSFFHGAQNGTMYFDQFMKSAGVLHYFGKNEYPNPGDDDGSWGIWDEPFLQWMDVKLGEFPQPFFSTVFTLSSHHPFKVPAAYDGKFPKGTSPIHEPMGYTDMALRKFFETASQQPWYQNTVFLITGDHTYKPERPGYQNEVGNYRIPLMIFAPGISLPKPDPEQVAQQVDILPTVIDLLGIPESRRNYLGNSVFVPGDRFAVNYWEGHYLLVAKDGLLVHNRDQDFQLYDRQDPSLSNPRTDRLERKAELENRLKAVIQYFSQGLWDNQLYYPVGR
jgi:phosphoglycerol transferase MdoB-like AlkP superfamily enzyme